MIPREYWDSSYGRGLRPSADGWFLPFLPKAPARILDAGCGSGENSGVLAGLGYSVTGFDLSSQAVALARQDVPQGDFLCLELESLPGDLGTGYDGVLADLVLHYHPWHETVAFTRALAGMMVSGGTLMFRVNASDDTEFGAGQGEEVEPGLYLVPSEGIVKRYFTESDVRRLMGETGLSIEGLEHAETTKYGGRTKRTWQGSARQG